MFEIQILKKNPSTKKYFIKEAHPLSEFIKGTYLASFKFGQDKLSLMYDAERFNLRIGNEKGYKDHKLKIKEIVRFLDSNYYICIGEPCYVDYDGITVDKMESIKPRTIDSTVSSNIK